jgi:hypothetical protein
MFRVIEEPAVLFETAGFLFFGLFKGIVPSEPMLFEARSGRLHELLGQQLATGTDRYALRPSRRAM